MRCGTFGHQCPKLSFYFVHSQGALPIKLCTRKLLHAPSQYIAIINGSKNVHTPGAHVHLHPAMEMCMPGAGCTLNFGHWPYRPKDRYPICSISPGFPQITPTFKHLKQIWKFKYGKTAVFFGRLRPDWGNTTRVATVRLGSEGS